MKIHVVCYEDYDAWILGKIARRLVSELGAAGMDVSPGKEPDPLAEVNHHFIYYDYVDRVSMLETLMFTHINDDRELAKFRRQLNDCGVMRICMSLETVNRTGM